MHNLILSLRFFLLLSVCAIASLHAQNQKLAYAYPMNTPTVDGSLEEWSADLPKYMIDHLHNDQNTHSEDFVGSFMVGYNADKKELYVGVEVIDSDHVGDDGESSHTTQDHVLLYFDEGHSRAGNAPLFLVAAENHLEILQKPAAWDATNAHFNEENVTVKIQRKGNRTTYEWKLTPKNPPMAGKVYAIDHYLIDQDRQQNTQSILLWKDEFGKSMSSSRMGEVILVDETTEMGWVNGQVEYADSSLQNKVNEVIAQSMTDKNWRVNINVGSTGDFQAYLPTGSYQLSNRNQFVLPNYSLKKEQNTRPLISEEPIPFSIAKDDTSTAKSLRISEKKRPDLLADKGILYTSKRLDKNKINEFIKAWKEHLKIPSVSVAIYHKGEIAYEETIGVVNNASQVPVNEQNIFEAASITKPVFATIVLRLAERGIIDLDKPLYEYLPFPNIEKDERSKLITARIVLNHQTGLPNWAWNGPGTWEGAGDLELSFEPGTKFGYSGEAFNYLGRVVEHITQKSLADLFQTEIVQPFGLTNTYFSYDDGLEKQVVQGHYEQFVSYKNKEKLISPASSLLTNAHDFSKFALGLMYEKNLQKDSYQKIYTPQTVLTEEEKIYDPEIPQYISHGFFVQETSNGKLIGHGGNNGDYKCKFLYNPDKKVGFAAFTNSNLGDEFFRALEMFLFRGKK